MIKRQRKDRKKIVLEREKESEIEKRNYMQREKHSKRGKKYSIPTGKWNSKI